MNEAALKALMGAILPPVSDAEEMVPEDFGRAEQEPLFHLFEEARRKAAAALGVDLDDDDILF
jgi:hypothetical protein